MPEKNYPEVNPNPDFPTIESEILAFWQKEGLFQESVDHRPAMKDGKNNEFIFYDGPPFANGLPHYGHLLTGFVKDLFARYETMKGKRVERRFGWDCHGLPAEMGSEKELGISGRQAIIHYGIGKFNEHCRDSVMKYSHEWETYVTRQARWVDFKNDYKTMNTSFMESVLWAFSQLYNKGLIYEAYRVMPYSWAAETPLSNFETKLDNSYREREDKAITVAFELNTPPKAAPAASKYYVLAWTTTPWTLPSNLALAVGKDMEYTYVSHTVEGGDPCCYIVGKSALARYAKELGVESVKDAVLETQHLYARALTEKDLDLLFSLHGDPEIGARQTGGVQTREQTSDVLKGYIAEQKERGYGQWAVFEKGTDTFIGRVGLTLRALDESASPKLELRYMLARDAWGKGYATELARACVAWGFEHLVAQEIVVGSAPNNMPSRKVMEKSGFRYVKDIVYKGEECVYYQITAEEFKKLDPKLRQDDGVVKGASLIGLSYTPLFPYFESHKHAFKILDGSGFVTDSDGTGIVHMAPGFGEDDQRCCEGNGIEVVVPVDGQGKYTSEIYDLPDLSLKGLNVIAETQGQRADEPYKPEQVKKYGLANLRIIQWLKEHGKLIKQEEIKHNYPHCWRTDQPLIYRAMPSWYVEVTKFRDRAVELNKQINWIPSHIRDGQMGHMLATAPDWSISRNRFWGTPIPVWRRQDSGSRIQDSEIKVFGSITELEDFFDLDACFNSNLNPESRIPNPRITDLHRPFIDMLTIAKDGSKWKRVEDVFDCWFESGSMPFAQVHYPFENKDWFENHFPADFITEYVGQTRGWFNTLIMLSTALFDKPPFKNCICHGVVLDAETGLKYSKRLKNYKDPLEVINVFGADALRWLMIASPVMRGLDLMVDPEGKFIRDVVRLAIKPIWNAYNFFCLYANSDGVKAKFATDSTDVMDRYILAKCKQAVESIQGSFDAYDTPTACEAVTQFFEALNNWYIRRNKERFWKTEHDADKQAAYDTLYTVLTTMCRAAAPLLPLTCEDIYRGLTCEKSVHLADFPDTCHPALVAGSGATKMETPQQVRGDSDEELIAQMDWVRDVCNSALAIRNKLNIRVRQPLSGLTLVGVSTSFIKITADDYFQRIVMDEVNVKAIHYVRDVPYFATLKLSINSAILGKRLPEKMKQILPASKKGEWKQIDGSVEIAGEKLLAGEYTLQLEPKPEYKDRAQALSTNDALVILDTTITPELEAEGIARDLVRMIQQARKDAALNVSDRIHLHLDAPEAIMKAAVLHKNYIMEQTLTVAFAESKPADAKSFGTTNAIGTIDEQSVTISLVKAA